MTKSIYIQLILLILTAAVMPLSAQEATITESKTDMGTYPFFDPDPVANPTKSIYPYFRYDGFSAQKVQKKWETVTLENPWIKVIVFPEIGGKVWTAIDKTTSRAFLYNNDVVKFRDIAMRGPWTSGGIEFNFGIIGHVPTSATPVDYTTKKQADGSVSCYISSFELLTHTTWQVEINLPKDKAYFTTHTIWFNNSGLDEPYYQWMNAAYPTNGDLQFCFPGTNYIGHDGSLHSFPKDEKGRDISWYKNNNFESSKSYHVLGKYGHFYSGYWHDYKSGSVHHSDYNAKLGQKIWIWSLARDGGIWEDLLTDHSGQYVELQAGRMYNQPAGESSRSPFKSEAFLPGVTDEWTEYWYPVKETGGIAEATNIGALNVKRENGNLILSFSPIQKLNTNIRILASGKEVLNEQLNTEILKTWNKSIPLTDEMAEGKLKVIIGNDALVYSEISNDNVINRPKKIPTDFDWNSVYGLYTSGTQYMNQRIFDKAETDLKAALEKDKYFAPALNRLASLYLHLGQNDKALELSSRSLSLNAYDAEANYIYGLANKKLGNYTDAKDGFSVASRSEQFRSVAFSELAGLSIRENDLNKAIGYAKQSVESNNGNLIGWQELLQCYRKFGNKEEAIHVADSLLQKFPLSHLIRYEKYAASPSESNRKEFASLVRNELPAETYQELAEQYMSIGSNDEAIDLLSMAQKSPISSYIKAWLLHLNGDEAKAKETVKEADAMSVELVFPSRPDDLQALMWAKTVTNSWKPIYFEALIRHANLGKTEAAQLMKGCQNADYLPFYIYRATLEEGAEQLADLKKAESLGKSWRTGNALIQHYSTAKNWEEAYKVASKYYKQYPNNNVICLQYATTLNETGRYNQCHKLLKDVTILPNEGASYGHEVYRKAYLYEAIHSMLNGKNAEARKCIELSKLWPENLGVGKPYETGIDYSTEKFLEETSNHPSKEIPQLLKSSELKLIKDYFKK
jgi:predicted Zn-dependent protease